MRRTAIFAIAAAMLASSAPAHAGEDEQVWGTVTVNVALPSHFKLSNETVVRSGNARGLYEV